VALERLEDYDGIGFVFTPDDPFAGIDLDNCRDTATGEIDPWAEEVLAQFGDTYAEVSPSGTGVKLFGIGALPGPGRHVGNVELYDSKRYFTVTGHKLPCFPSEVSDCQPALTGLYESLGIGQANAVVNPNPLEGERIVLGNRGDIIGQAMRAANGLKFQRLFSGDWSGYASLSEARLALCRMLAFWCGPQPSLIDAYFRQSGLMCPKWDSRRGATTYRQGRIAKALRDQTEFYVPGRSPARCSPKASGKPRAQRASGAARRELGGVVQGGRVPPGPPHCVLEECPTPTPQQPPSVRERLLDHVRSLRLQHGREVGLSARQAAKAIGISKSAANRHLKALVDDGQLIEVKKGSWDKKAGKPGLASFYDLPEFAPATDDQCGHTTVA
jgi:hypothetical protein